MDNQQSWNREAQQLISEYEKKHKVNVPVHSTIGNLLVMVGARAETSTVLIDAFKFIVGDPTLWPEKYEQECKKAINTYLEKTPDSEKYQKEAPTVVKLMVEHGFIAKKNEKVSVAPSSTASASSSSSSSSTTTTSSTTTHSASDSKIEMKLIDDNNHDQPSSSSASSSASSTSSSLSSTSSSSTAVLSTTKTVASKKNGPSSVHKSTLFSQIDSALASVDDEFGDIVQVTDIDPQQQVRTYAGQDPLSTRYEVAMKKKS